jgi:hypothetical protein
MMQLLQKHGMAALTVAFGVTMTSLAVALTAVGDVERSQCAILFVAGLLVLGGMIAVHRGLRGGRPAVALGAIVAGLMLVWSVVTPIVSLVILVWLVAGRQPARAPIQPA